MIGDTSPPDPANDLRHGAMLRAGGRSTMGDWLQIAFKAYVPEESDELRWELRRICPSAGYPCTQEKHLLSDTCNAQEQTWDTKIFKPLHMPITDHYGKSYRSCYLISLTHSSPVNASSDQEYWWSTPGLVAIVAFWTHWRRETRMKKNGARLFFGSSLNGP